MEYGIKNIKNIPRTNLEKMTDFSYYTKIIQKCLILILFFIFPIQILSNNKNLQFEHIGIKDGLSQNQVNTILFD